MQLQAGQFTGRYENGFLRYIELAGKEIVRMIYFAVRDRDWNTIPGTISKEEVNQTPTSFSIRYQLDVREGGIQMQWQVEIIGLPDSTIRFDVHGEVLHTFLRNRLGICVLHPIEGLAGKPCLIGHPDGSTTESAFPSYVSPYQPFKNIRFMQWQSGEKAIVKLELEGDVFETEDHRNWTDASYKTYCTPLDLPFPVEVQAGTQIHQRCTLHLLQAPPEVAAVSGENFIEIQVANHSTPFPDLGLGLHAERDELTEQEVVFLQSLHLSHLRTDVFLHQPNWQVYLHKAVRQSNLVKAPLELALFFGDNPSGEIVQVLAQLAHYRANVKQILLFDAAGRLTTIALVRKVVSAIRLALSGCKIGGGTDANFAELNRHPFDYSLLDFVSFSANPQVHATDDLTLIENMAAQADAVLSARRLSSGKPVHISSVTLKPRFNAVATSGEANTVPPADSRQGTPFIAGWTLGSFKYLSEAGASAITYFETTGSRGICEGQAVYPVGKLLAFIQQNNFHRIYQTRSSKPLALSSLLLESVKGKFLLLANHTSTLQKVKLPENTSIQTSFSLLNAAQPKIVQDFIVSVPALDILLLSEV